MRVDADLDERFGSGELRTTNAQNLPFAIGIAAPAVLIFGEVAS